MPVSSARRIAESNLRTYQAVATLRAVRTDENTAGYKGATAATAVPLTLKSSYTDWLPSLNARLTSGS